MVNVGEPSDRETRRQFRGATDRLFLLTKSLGYIDTVRPAMRDAVNRVVHRWARKADLQLSNGLIQI